MYFIESLLTENFAGIYDGDSKNISLNDKGPFSLEAIILSYDL